MNVNRGIVPPVFIFWFMKKKMNISLLPVISLCIILAASCNNTADNNSRAINNSGLTANGMSKYLPENYFDNDEIDSLLIDIATYVGVKPKTATALTRFEHQHRNYYRNYASEFKLVYYHIDYLGDHYFYLLRPGRGKHGNMRGVGGRMRIEQNQITAFEEIFNTFVYDEKTLINKGKIIFPHLVMEGNVDQFASHPDLIEWPDDRLAYDKSTFEWRYK